MTAFDDLPPLPPDPGDYADEAVPISVEELDAMLRERKRSTGPSTDARMEHEQTDAERFIASWRHRLIDGATWLRQNTPGVDPLWGTGDRTVWAARKQPTIIVGFSGVGKTTLAQHITLGAIGVPGFETVLGYPVQPLADETSSALYLASDRPDQARLALRRLVTTEEAWNIVERRLVVWAGPPPIAVSMRPTLLREMAEEAGAALVVPDSLKDMALKLSDDEVSATINASHQHLVADDIDVIALHHPRKRSNVEGTERRPTIDDLYGGAWIGNGAGSVLFLIREPTSVEMVQVKSPLGAEDQSLRYVHDTNTGSLTIGERDAVLAAVYDAGPSGISTPNVARWVHDGHDTTDAQVEQVRRRLKALQELGLVRERKASSKSKGNTWVHHEH